MMITPPEIQRGSPKNKTCLFPSPIIFRVVLPLVFLGNLYPLQTWKRDGHKRLGGGNGNYIELEKVDPLEAKQMETTTNNKRQTTNNKQLTTHTTHHTPHNKQQTTNNKQQTANNKQQTTNNKQQTTTCEIPSFQLKNEHHKVPKEKTFRCCSATQIISHTL